MPDISVSEFLKFLENKFLTHAYIYPESRAVDFVTMESVIDKQPDLDITSQLDGEAKFYFGETKGVKLSSVTDIEGAAPAAATIFDLAKIYNSVVEVNETDWQAYNWQALGIPTYTPTMILRKATGQFYSIYFRRYGGPTNFNRLGSNYFSFAQPSVSNYQEYEAADYMPPIVEVVLGLTADDKQAVIFCPAIGNSSRRNIKLTSESSETPAPSEQKIIIAYAAGKANTLALGRRK